MQQPTVIRPMFPDGYVENPTSFLTWAHVVKRLTEAKNCWICSVRPNGHPHVIPKWGVWIDDRYYFDGSPETRHARNIAENPHVSLHLEDGFDVVIVEGIAGEAERPTPEMGERLAAAYGTKYAEMDYKPKPNQWDEGGLFQILPTMVLAWTDFAGNPTKFVFEDR